MDEEFDDMFNLHCLAADSCKRTGNSAHYVKEKKKS